MKREKKCKHHRYCTLTRDYNNVCKCFSPQIPSFPRLPRNFCWSGHYIIPDLKMTVPFTWTGNNGNSQMIAGNTDYPVWFTNIIYNGVLYTNTYKWPSLKDDEKNKCVKVLDPFTIDDLNTFFASSSYVGEEVLKDNGTCQRVNHFRLSIALPKLPPGNFDRLPILSADIYVDQKDSTKFVKVLHFGLQNKFNPNLDEWFTINKFRDIPGKVNLPCSCESL